MHLYQMEHRWPAIGREVTDDECVGTPSLYNLVTPPLSSQVLPVMRRPLNRLMASFISCLSPWRAKYNVDLYMYLEERITVLSMGQLLKQNMTGEKSEDNCLSKIQHKIIFGDE